ncbi:MAG: GNAT family N-acetyltransferase [Armatimonadota bacterium]
MNIDDVPGVVALQRACFPEPFPEDSLFKPAHVSMHVSIFPSGQFVASLEDGTIVASSTTMLMTSERWVRHLPFGEATGGLALTRHEGGGDVLCGIDISVHPAYRGQGLAGQLYQARFNLVKDKGLRLYGTVCRMPDFASEPHGLTPHGYAQQVADGWRKDRTLTPLLRIGLAYRGVITSYMEDSESGHAGAILEWIP